MASKTGKMTDRGRPVWRDDETGEDYSERSTTFSSSRKDGEEVWYTVPTVGEDGTEYSEDVMRDYVKEYGPVDWMTGEELPEFRYKEDAIEYAKSRSNSMFDKQRGYSEGGEVQQMKNMYDEGGLATDGMDVDPVSGNDIPVGSNAEDVRDDVDTKLSSGEYVVPADVVKYLGVAQLEKLVDKAKVGLEDMEANGRIGGAPVEEPEEVVMTLGGDLGTLDGYASGGMVAGTDIDGIIDRVKGAAMKDPSIMNMLKAKGIFVEAVKPSEATPAKMAEGGLLDTTNTTSSFDPFAYTPGFSVESGATGGMPGRAPSVPGIPNTLTPVAPAPAPAPIKQPELEENYDSYTQEGTTDTTGWMDNFDYTTPQGLFDSTMTTLSVSGKDDKNALGQVTSAIFGSTPIGKAVGFIGKAVAVNNIAQARANASVLSSQGKTDEAKAITDAVSAYAKAKGVDSLSKVGTGTRLAKAVEDSGVTSRWGGKNIAGIDTAGAMTKQSAAVQQGYQNYADLGKDRATSWSGGQVAESQEAPSYGSSEDAMASAQDAADDLGVGMATGGRAKGGLVDRRVKLKPTPTKNKKTKTTTTKKGLGSK
jgi:hypothetical protein